MKVERLAEILARYGAENPEERARNLLQAYGWLLSYETEALPAIRQMTSLGEPAASRAAAEWYAAHVNPHVEDAIVRNVLSLAMDTASKARFGYPASAVFALLGLHLHGDERERFRQLSDEWIKKETSK